MDSVIGKMRRSKFSSFFYFKSIEILQSYLDRTSDVQLVGAISSHLFFLEFPNVGQLIKFSYEYKNLLNINSWFEERALFDIELNEFEKIFVNQKNMPQGLLSASLS